MPALSLRTLWLLLTLLATAISPAGAVSTRSVVDDDYAALSQGELKSAALGSDGLLRPTWAREQLGVTGAEIVWDVLREERGSLLCATGHAGRIVRINNNQTTDSVTTFSQAEVTALARVGEGRVLVATAPGAHLYLLGADDRVTTLTSLPASLVWRLVPDGAGGVWALTGAEGKLFHLRFEGETLKVEETAKLRSRNLLSCWMDSKGEFGPRGALYIGGQDPGWLYRVKPGQTDVEVLFNASAEEVRAVVPVAEGLALAINTERAPTPQVLQLTMRMAGAGGMMAINPQQRPPQQGGQPTGGDAEQERALNQAFQQAQQRQGYGAPGSRIVILRRDGFSRDLWTAPEAPIHDLAAAPGEMLIAAAGNQGRLFGIAADATWSIAADTREDYLIRLVPDGDRYLVTAARNGLVFALDPAKTGAAEYLSRALDAGKPVRWGRLYLRGLLADDARVSFRMGNAGDVEADAWTAWSTPVKAGHDAPVDTPEQISRYLQYKVTLPAAREGQPVQLDQVEVFFTEPNTAPIVQDLQVADAGASGAAKPPQPGQPPKPPQPMPQPQPQPGAAPGQPAAASAPQVNQRDPHSNPMTLNIAWRTSDPNDDVLRYALYFRARDEHAWKLIDDELEAPQMALNISGVADGYYTFRVVASDELANPDGAGLSAEKVSDEILVDNSAPTIDGLKATPAGNRARLQFRVEDAWALLSSIKIDINNGDAHPVFPVDGIYDQRSETIDWETPALSPGEYVATINATDRQGNTATAKIVFTIGR